MWGICLCINFICKNNRIYIIVQFLLIKLYCFDILFIFILKKGEIYEELRSKVELFVLSDEVNKFVEKKVYCIIVYDLKYGLYFFVMF